VRALVDLAPRNAAIASLEAEAAEPPAAAIAGAVLDDGSDGLQPVTDFGAVGGPDPDQDPPAE